MQHSLPRTTIGWAVMLVLWVPAVNSLSAQNRPDSGERLLASVAFLPDIHFHDIFGEFADGTFEGLPTTFGGMQRMATIRTMEAQLQSTRLFNENYFALLAALDDVVAKGIRWIALPGDFSDDGQTVHLRGLRKILDYYHDQYGLEFFAAPGNHDPTTPFRSAAGKRDFLGPQGRPQPVFTPDHPACLEPGGLAYPEGISPHPVICSHDIEELGYEGVLEFMREYGLMPKAEYLYFETPYSDYGAGPYQFDEALVQADLALRQYEICLQGTGGPYKKPHFTQCFEVADLTYLVEPVAGLWLLAIDANVYVPRSTADERQPESANNFEGSGSAGYNRMITHKQHVVAWIADVVQRAETEGKTLVAFSHFPMTEFYDGAQALVPDLFDSDGTFQQRRMPTASTSLVLARTGLKLHIGGHMHQNDTGVITDEENGHTLINVQAPSLAAYKPAYKILHLFTDLRAEIETILLDDVAHFRTLFPHYEAEWNYLDSVDYPRIWNKEVLGAVNYAEYTNWHMRELARLRFFPGEWPEDLQQVFPSLSGWEMVVLSQLSPAVITNPTFSLQMIQHQDVSQWPDSLRLTWQAAELSALVIAKQSGWEAADFRWTGQELVLDFYRLQNADELALIDISPDRMRQYALLWEAFRGGNSQTVAELGGVPTAALALLVQRLRAVFALMSRFSAGAPSQHFSIDMKNGALQRLDP